jgi:hypothetical protein
VCEQPVDLQPPGSIGFSSGLQVLRKAITTFATPLSVFLFVYQSTRLSVYLSSYLPVCPFSVRMEQLGSRWTDFHEI